MQTLSWQENDIAFEEEYGSPQLREKNMTIEETDESFQLKKFQDPSNNQQRQNYFTLLEKFAVLLRQGDLDQIARDLLTEDCEIFIFNSNGRTPVRNSKGLGGFIELFRGMAIQARRLRETNMDADKSMACQICNYKIIYDDSDIVIDEIACEIFSIRDGRISKYRGSFGNAYMDDPLEPTRKDKMLAKVKEINYALAGQPDFEKLASLFSENTEYKIWRWDDFKYLALYKKDFTVSVKILEENMSIRNIVPYEISADIEGRFISGTYVYHLEDNFSGQKYDWLSTCIYAFDENINLKLISQQGELYPEGEIKVPFETQTREKLEKKIRHLNSNNFMNLHLVDSENVLYDCSCWTVCSVCKPGLRCFEGFKDVDKQQMKVSQFKDFKLDFVETVDIFVDFHNKSHDVVVAMMYSQGTKTGCCLNKKEKTVNTVGIIRAAFENGKLAKIVGFLSGVDGAIDSPFDDKSFQSRNIKSTNE